MSAKKIITVEQLRDAALERFAPLIDEASLTEAERARFTRALKRVLHWSAEEQLAAQSGNEGARDHAVEQRLLCIGTLEQSGLLKIVRTEGAIVNVLSGFVEHVIEAGTPIAAAAAQSASAAIATAVIAKLGG